MTRKEAEKFIDTTWIPKDKSSVITEATIWSITGRKPNEIVQGSMKQNGKNVLFAEMLEDFLTFLEPKSPQEIPQGTQNETPN